MRGVARIGHRGGWRALALAALLGLGAAAARAEQEPASVLAVQGEGVVLSAPDLAYVRIGVTVQAPRAADAQAQVSGTAERILAALQKLKVEARDVQTAQLTIGPYYRRDDTGGGPPAIAGYEASNVVRVTVRELAKLGAVVDAALSAGGNRVDGVDFALRDDRDARKEALRRAVADARAKGAAMNEALGTKLGRVRALREQGASVGPAGGAMLRMAAADAVGTPTSPGEIEVRAQVALEYALE